MLSRRVAGISSILIFLLAGCGEDKSIYNSYPLYGDTNTSDREYRQGMFIDDANTSDITSILDVETISVQDNGIFVLCTEGSTCSVTVDNSVHDVNNTATTSGDSVGDTTGDTTTTDNNSSSGV